ncbi:MAG TPA: CoA pyrophosphatase [Actinomycetales bacterium]|nr:CoA pyrophosphatase [Actinomycetales bacterium]
MTASLPAWAQQVADVLPDVAGHHLSRFLPPPGAPVREAAVLMLFGAGRDDAGEVLLIERSKSMRSHPGQAAFPGGAVDPTDDGAVAAALREAAEETGLDPAGVEVLGTLPRLYLPPSGFAVTPVVAWWRTESPVGVADPREVARVDRVPLPALLDPLNRSTVRHPSGFVGPAFGVGDLFVWGFTAGLLSRLLNLAGLEKPWDDETIEDLPPEHVPPGDETEIEA